MAEEKGSKEEEEGMLETTKTTTITMAATSPKDSSESKAKPTVHERNMSKFAIACVIIQCIFAILYLVMVRYGKSALPGNLDSHELKKNLEKYPLILDVNMMLVGGFGFLMAFVRRFTFSALGLTFIVVTFVTEWTILLRGFVQIATRDNSEADEDAASYTFGITFHDILEAGFAAAAVLISVGGVLGKLNPFQVLCMAVVEAAMFVLNSYIGYTILGVIDVGGAIFIHAFGAYFGLAVSMMSRKRDMAKSGGLEGSRYTSDIFSLLGTVLLWIYWPSFNAVLAEGDAQHRAVINTYISLVASTLATFIISALLGERKRFQVVDIQNATLSGGVAVGALADLMIQPGGAFVMGTICGVVSCLGYRLFQGTLFEKLKLHDTCGINNLHGMPGIISALASAVVLGTATEATYGKEGLNDWLNLYEDGTTGRSPALQAGFQLIGLGVTLFIAIATGAFTGFVLNVSKIFEPLSDFELFNDAHFWTLPDDVPVETLDASTAVEMTCLDKTEN